SDGPVYNQGPVSQIGLTNTPTAQARELEAAMNAATAAPTHERIAGLLDAMHSIPSVLLILNHPLSSEARVPAAEHRRLLLQFLAEYGQWMHALELNGLQPAADNVEVIRLAAARDTPVIAGGDRHCTEPNPNINLTRARSFAEFVDEVRVDGRSSVLFMPQYRDPIPSRYIEFIWQAVRTYPALPGRERW